MLSSYREHPAPTGLAGVVACVWRNETTATRQLRVLPDGCMDLIWMNGAVHVAGPDTRAFLTTMGSRQVVTGLRFRPGAAPGVLGVPAWALRDQRLHLEDLWPGTTVSQRIAEVSNPAVGLAAVVAARVTEPDLALSAVLSQLQTGSSVAATAAALGWTERTLHRRCRDVFGYGPSVLRRILRFRLALRVAGQGVSFVATAARAGYADQAHLAREVRALAGVPLGQLIAGQRAYPPDTGDMSAGHTMQVSRTRRGGG
ncbi:MAG TPA: helix-turn-helix domain-containing protein [Pseudonocardiaceae bacterium]|jgi:AraC-like DNA-binding protein|nr:helix-turn-helix domain-containing protein [Pseudonocardiaceae bacterium]